MADSATWRVYLREWVTVYTADDGQEAWDRFTAEYRGRVRDEDVRVQETGATGQVLQLRMPNRRGEFKDRADAMTLASALKGGQPDGAVSTVRRGSAEEQELLDYGRKMLPGAG